MGSALLVGPARAASPPQYRVTSFTQQDTNGDGRPDEAVIHCACYSKDDRIVVIDTSNSMRPSDRVEQGTNMSDDLWLFDVGDRGSFQIAVQFHDSGGALSADLFEDENGDGHVSVGKKSGKTVVTEPGFPVIHLVAVDGYWQRNGRIAPDFDITVDGRMMATFGGELYEAKMKNDGSPDVDIQVRGPHDGDPRSYDWRNVVLPLPVSSAVRRSSLNVRESGEEPAFPPVFPWFLLGATYGPIQNYAGGVLPTTPLVGSGNRPYGMVKPYGESFPPIQVDWNSGKVEYLGEFVASRGSDVNWFTLSNNLVKPGKVNNLDFESPFAFYNLSNSQSSTPDLEVRVERTTPDDGFSAPSWDGRPYQQVRYSWEQLPGQGWSYKLGLLGQNAIPSTVPFPGFALRTIPYDQLPSWVTKSTWDIATFVAVEDRSYSSTEGIYDWDTPGAVRDSYYAGATSDPGELPTTISVGLRGEYTLHLNGQPWLYLSPVDDRLHLVGAQYGVYQSDETNKVVYQNLDGGQHIDAWQLFVGATLTQQLYQLPSGLLYAEAGMVSLLDTPVAAETLRTLPPSTHDEWEAIGQRLGTSNPPPANDLQAMFEKTPGARATISNAMMSGLRFTSTGYRFVLELKPGYQFDGINIGGVTGPGKYVVTNDSATSDFSASPATDPNPQVLSINARVQATALSSIDVSADFLNSGTQDLEQLPAVITAQLPGHAPIVIQQQAIDLLATNLVNLDGSWGPPVSGTWTLKATLYLPQNKTMTRTQTVDILPATRPKWSSVITGAWIGTRAPLYLSLLVGLISLPLAAGFIVLRRES